MCAYANDDVYGGERRDPRIVQEGKYTGLYRRRKEGWSHNGLDDNI